MSAQQNAETTKKIYDWFNQGDFDSCIANANDDIQIDLIPMGMVFKGHDGFRNFMGGFKNSFPDIKIWIKNQIAADDSVVTEFGWSGTNTGPLPSPQGEIPPTGKKVNDAIVCEVWDFRNGKVSAIRNYQDISLWLRQLGLVP